jgi:uncharacterized protein (DUF302 family)
MTYFILKSTQGDFDAVVGAVTQRLKDEGFGVLSDIDVASTLKQKLGVAMPRYRILGACNPGFAQKALDCEEKIGVMLPCNVVVQDKGEGKIDVFAIDPRAAMQTIGNPELTKIAEEVAQRLSRIVASV